MRPKKSTKERHVEENSFPPKTPATKNSTQVNHEKRQEKTDDVKQGSAPDLKSKPANKRMVDKSSQNLKWVLGRDQIYKTDGNKVTFVSKREESNFSGFPYDSIAMLIQDGAAPVSGEHFWTVNFGGLKPKNWNWSEFVGISNSRWFKKKYGLFYSGILSKNNTIPNVEFGPLINFGDVVGVLCSFSESEGHLNLYIYHNGRCLGLTFQVPASLFLPEGIRPCVILDNVGVWATITKEPKENIPKKKDRVRAPVDQFGIEGVWRFKHLVDSTSGNVISLNLKEKTIKWGTFKIKTYFKDAVSELFFVFWLTHYVAFSAKKKMNNLWTKTSSDHDFDLITGQPEVWDHSLFVDFPIVAILHSPEYVVLQDQEMRVTKENQTAIFERIYKIRKGNVFKD